MSELILAWTTVASKDAAEEIAQRAVQNRLAACVQIEGPVHSYYLWEGKVENESEWRLFFKTTSEKAAGLRTWVTDVHPYDTPEWISVATDDCISAYLNWAKEVLN